MLRSSLSVLAAVLLIAPLAIGDEALYVEQQVVVEAVSGQPAMRGLQRTWVTDGAVRNEIGFGQGKTSVLLVDVGSERVVLIPSDEKQYVQLTLDEYLEVVSMRLRGTGLAEDGAQPALEATGKTRTIGGWNCTGYRFRQQGKLGIDMELWVAGDTREDFAAYLRTVRRIGLDRMLGRMGELADQLPGFPVEVTMDMVRHGQKVTSSQRVRSIETRTVEPDLFEVPPGYDRIDDSTLHPH